MSLHRARRALCEVLLMCDRDKGGRESSPSAGRQLESLSGLPGRVPLTRPCVALTTAWGLYPGVLCNEASVCTAYPPTLVATSPFSPMDQVVVCLDSTISWDSPHLLSPGTQVLPILWDSASSSRSSSMVTGLGMQVCAPSLSARAHWLCTWATFFLGLGFPVSDKTGRITQWQPWRGEGPQLQSLHDLPQPLT